MSKKDRTHFNYRVQLYFHIVFALDEEDMDIDVITFVAYQLPWLTDLK